MSFSGCSYLSLREILNQSLNSFQKYYRIVELWNYLGQCLSLYCYNNKCKYRLLHLKILKSLLVQSHIHVNLSQ